MALVPGSRLTGSRNPSQFVSSPALREGQRHKPAEWLRRVRKVEQALRQDVSLSWSNRRERTTGQTPEPAQRPHPDLGDDHQMTPS